jgi:UPF0716 protein FxsA
MALWLFLMALPLIEIGGLIWAGQVLGFWATMGIIVATGALGILVLLRQRFAMLTGMIQAVNKGQHPIAPVVDGAFHVLAAGLLISPGLLGDVVGLLLLAGPIRRRVARWSIERMLRAGGVHFDVFADRTTATRESAPKSHTRMSGPVIEGEFERLSEPTGRPKTPDDAEQP